METKALKKQLGAAIAMVLVAAIALGAATFAWFVNNNAVTAKGVDVNASSSVPNLYINSAGKTTGTMTGATTNPGALYPVSTNDGSAFYETLSWTNGAGNHAVANKDQSALVHEKDKTVYADYTFDLGVANGKMNVYFDSGAATTLAANPDTNMGTAGRFAIKFGNGGWTLFKVKGSSTNNGYYTDAFAEKAESGQTPPSDDYWVTAAGGSEVVAKAGYADMGNYSGSINQEGKVQVNDGVSPLVTLDSADASNQGQITVTVRVWYEGCDKDCVSENAGTGIKNAIQGNLGFVGVAA